VVCSCEHGSEPSGSVKCMEFLDWLSLSFSGWTLLCGVTSSNIKSWFDICSDFILAYVPFLCKEIRAYCAFISVNVFLWNLL